MHIYEHLGELFAGVYRPVIFEFGAHEGWDTQALLAVLHDPVLYALEPDSRNLALLRKNGLHRRALIIPAAIGARNGVTTLFQSTKSAGISDTGSASSIRKPGAELYWVEFETSEEVRVVSFDRLCEANGIRHVDFIWADVQGAERDMILGGQRALRHTMYLYTEYSDSECYEGQWTLSQILHTLQDWEVIENYEPQGGALAGDVLLRNTRYARERSEFS